MQVRDIMTPRVFFIKNRESLQLAADKMRELDVGILPVAEGDTDSAAIVGVITDRDIVVRAVAKGKDPNAVTVEDAMTPEVVTVDEHADPNQAANIMAQRQIRRLLVTDGDNNAVGVLAMGDLAVDWESQPTGQALGEVSRPAEPAD
ncbi:MAG: CBS domain-containing protein [Desulfatibacillaceae bacterium]